MSDYIDEIVDASFRQGTGAKGAWTLMKVRTNNGKIATVFAPAKIGDELELEYNQEYKNWNGKVIQAKFGDNQRQPEKPPTSKTTDNVSWEMRAKALELALTSMVEPKLDEAINKAEEYMAYFVHGKATNQATNDELLDYIEQEEA